MHQLLLPSALTASPFAPLLVNKAIKRLRYENIRPSTIVFSKALDAITAHRIINTAAMEGLLAQTGDVPPAETAFQFIYNDTIYDLTLPNDLCDWHAHTQFAYCGRGIDFYDAAQLSLALGIRMQGFSEHAFALYFPSDALKFYWQSDPDFVEKIWATEGRGRMVAYKQLIAQARPLLGPKVRFGLELDLFGGGRCCLAPEDYDRWDYLIGAIHEVEGITSATPRAQAESLWMRDIERLLALPIKILAHPFRYFPWCGRPVPRDLYRPVAKMLKEAMIAAEINHHKNPFELEFFHICLEEGVKLSLGSDAHVTRDIADLSPHLKTLEALGITTPKARDEYLLPLHNNT